MTTTLISEKEKVRLAGVLCRTFTLKELQALALRESDSIDIALVLKALAAEK
mgnify:CR=1 FL=1